MGDNKLSGNFWRDWGVGSDVDSIGPADTKKQSKPSGPGRRTEPSSNHNFRNGAVLAAAALVVGMVASPNFRDGTVDTLGSGYNYVTAKLGQVSVSANRPDPVDSAVLFPTKADPSKKISIATIEIEPGHVRQEQDPKTKATKVYEVGVKITVDPDKFSQVSTIDPSKVGQNQYLPYVRSFNDPAMTQQCFADLDQAALTAKSHPELWLPKTNGNTQPQKEFKNAEVLYMVEPFTNVPDNPGKVNIVVSLVNGNENNNLVNPKNVC